MTASSIRADDGLEAALGQLKAFASSLGRDSEDLVQEALTRAIANGVPVEAVPWMRTVMRRLAIDRSRRAREVASGDSFDMDALAAEPGLGPEDQVLSGERAQAVREALDALPPRYREALVAYATDGRASAVAEQMSLSSQATWTLLSRARGRLRTQLERVGFVPGVFVSRLGPWWSNATTGAAAVCCLLVVIGGGGPATSPESTVAPPQRVSAAAAQPLVRAEIPVPVVAPTEHALPEAPAVEATAAEHSRPAEYGAEACPTGEDEHVRFGIWFYEDEQPSTLVPLLRSLPEQVRSRRVEGCES